MDDKDNGKKLCIPSHIGKKDFYTPAEAAEILGVSTWTLRQMRQMGRIKGNFLGNTTLYTEEQLENAVLPRPKKPKKTLTGSRACA